MLKDPVFNKANIIYRGRCSGSEFYVGYTKQNSKERWRVHCSNKKTSEVDVFCSTLVTQLNWEILTNVPIQIDHWNILQAFYIRTHQPTLNNQLDTTCTLLFRNGITNFSRVIYI